MLDQTKIYDFIIIGCGPSGATIATYLAKLGHSVLVFEKAKFPRRHEGESLLPFCYEIFKDLGIWEEMKTKFVRKPGTRFSSQDGKSNSTFCFKNVIHHEGYMAFNVYRSEFDLSLMNNCIKNGATVLQETKVESVNLDAPDKIVEVETMNLHTGRSKWKARFLIDASGQDTFLSKRMNSKKPYAELDRVAFLGHWTGGKYINGLDVGLLNIIYLEAGKKGWFAIQPVGKDLLSVAFVVERKYLKEKKKLLKDQGIEDWQNAFYKLEIENCKAANDVLTAAEMHDDLFVISDYSYFSDKMYGDNYMLLGDAYKFLDPIFSSGIYLGMKTAKLFSEALHVKMNADKQTGDKKMEDTLKDVTGAYNLVAKFIDIFYDPDSLNLSEVLPESGYAYTGYEQVYAMVHWLLAGDFFANYKKYDDFLNIIKDPEKYKTWKKLSVNISRPNEPACNLEYSDVFGSIID